MKQQPCLLGPDCAALVATLAALKGAPLDVVGLNVSTRDVAETWSQERAVEP